MANLEESFPDGHNHDPDKLMAAFKTKPTVLFTLREFACAATTKDGKTHPLSETFLADFLSRRVKDQRSRTIEDWRELHHRLNAKL